MSFVHNSGADIGTGSVVRATVLLAERYIVFATPDGCDATVRVACDVLCSSGDSPPLIAAGDAVLVWRATPDSDSGVVLGRIGPSRAAASAAESAMLSTPVTAAPPDELVIEAAKTLTLKVGDGSITIRDGKILIKGKDLVSHAARTNRIKGGSVAIN
ncbi:MAG: hypothetical protein M3303_16135 [Gemmatimonadota bacterium]|nr:hypothetical protein [Gemmatimonadota bacterium]